MVHYDMETDQKIPTDINEIIQQLENDFLTILPQDETIQLAIQLNEFPLGKFILYNRKLNDYWINYIIQDYKKQTTLHPLEEWILLKSPMVIAYREHYFTIKQTIQDNLQSDMHIASITSGFMRELLTLDVNDLSNIQVTEVDLDDQSFNLAKEDAPTSNITYNFIKEDPWRLKQKETFDIITNKTLTILEPTDAKVFNLYKRFYNALKPNGKLIISYISPPPDVTLLSPWKNYDLMDFRQQTALMIDIIELQDLHYRSDDMVIKLLNTAGFSDITITHGTYGVFPVVTANKKIQSKNKQ